MLAHSFGVAASVKGKDVYRYDSMFGFEGTKLVTSEEAELLL